MRRIIRSSIAGAIPSPTELGVAQLGVNLADRILYTKDENGQVISVGGGSGGGGGSVYAIISDTAPTAPTNGMIWVDTSVEPEVLNIWGQVEGVWYQWETDSLEIPERKIYITGISAVGGGTVNVTTNGFGEVIAFETADQYVNVTIRCISDETYIPEVKVGLLVGNSETPTDEVTISSGLNLSHGYWVDTIQVDVTNLASGGSIIATHSNGSTAEASAVVSDSPVITSNFIGGSNIYPNAANGQTHFKQNDSMEIDVVSTQALSSITIINGSGTDNALQPKTVNNPSGGQVGNEFIYTVPVNANSTGQGERTYSVSAKNLAGFTSNIYTTSSEAVQADGVTFIRYDNVRPNGSFDAAQIFENGVLQTRTAMVDEPNEEARIDFITNTNAYDDESLYEYTFTSGQDFDIVDPTDPSNPKVCTLKTGFNTYRVTGTNLSVTIFKPQNQTSRTISTLIPIVAEAPQLTFTFDARFPSGGLGVADPSFYQPTAFEGGVGNMTNDSPSIGAPQSYTIRVDSNQPLTNFSIDPQAGYGVLGGTWQPSNGNTRWTNTLIVNDTDTSVPPDGVSDGSLRGAAQFHNLQGMNQGNVDLSSTSPINYEQELADAGELDYYIGGFITRKFRIFRNDASRCFDLGVPVSDINKVTATVTSLGNQSMTYSDTLTYDDSTERGVFGFTIMNRELRYRIVDDSGNPLPPTDPDYVDLTSTNNLTTDFGANVVDFSDPARVVQPEDRYFFWLNDFFWTSSSVDIVITLEEEE